jgi:hypothetical protein
MPTTRSIVHEAPVESVKLAAINVAAHPHSDKNVYEKLFRACTNGANNSPLVARFRGNHAGVVSHFKKQDDYFVGTLVTFIQLDEKDAWGNPRTGEAATEEEIKSISLPGNLQPGFKRHEFIFSPLNHRLIVNANEMSPNTWKAALFRILDIAKDRLSLEEVDVTVEPVSDTVRRMLKMDISKLTILLLRPNPDDLSDLDAEVLDRMAKQHVNREKRELSAPRGQFLAPDEATIKLAEVAKSNGRVDAVVHTNGKAEPRSTVLYPWTKIVPVGINGIIRTLRDGLDMLNERIRK